AIGLQRHHVICRCEPGLLNISRLIDDLLVVEKRPQAQAEQDRRSALRQNGISLTYTLLIGVSHCRLCRGVRVVAAAINDVVLNIRKSKDILGSGRYSSIHRADYGRGIWFL